ncbi:MAG: hypothetical protein HY654_04175 [Acidobacteria bacterium]|nr:hypothetical protein [Acidobacteriota bacterium]
MRARAFLIALGLLLFPFRPAVENAAQDLPVTSHTHPCPEELPAAIKAIISPGGVTVRVRAATIEFWFVKQLAVGGKAEWEAVPEGALVGALRTSGPYADLRGRTLKPGVYTMRSGLQPEDKDHFAVWPHRAFLLVSPAVSESTAEPVGHQGAVDLAKQATGIAHPAVLGLNPLTTSDPLFQVQTPSPGFKSVVVEVPTSTGAPLRFGIVVSGRVRA